VTSRSVRTNVKGEIRNERSREAQGQRAGFVSQALGTGLDAVVIFALDFAALIVFGFLRFLVNGDDFEIPQPGPIGNATLVVVIGVLLLWSSWSGSGRAPGMAVMGLRVVGKDGRPLSSRRAFWRAVLAVLTVGLGVIVVAFSKRNRSLYDMIVGSAVVYSWRALPETRQNQ
jgi:uncharacterized RDD family membrane protein YckC